MKSEDTFQRRIVRAIGALVLVVSAIGALTSFVMAAVMPEIAETLVERLADQHADRLVAAGVPAEIADRVRALEPVADDARASLTVPQRRELETAEQMIASMRESARRAGRMSRIRSLATASVFVVGAVIGYMLVRRRGQASRDDASGERADGAPKVDQT